MICPKCGKKVRYVAINSRDVVCCDDEEKVFYTVNGSRKTGYLLHICEGKNGNKENTGRN